MENSTKLVINVVLCLNVTLLTKQNFHHRYNSSFIDCSGKSSGLLPSKSLRNSHHIPSPHPISSSRVQHLRYPPHFPMSISSIPSIWYQNHNLFLGCVRVDTVSLASFWFNAISLTFILCPAHVRERTLWKLLSFTNPREMFSLIIKVAFSWRIVFSDFSSVT